MMSRSITKRAPQPTHRYPLTIAVLVAVTALVAAACSAGSTTRAASQPAAAQHAAPITPIRAYVGLFKDNAVAVLDTGSHRVIKTIPVPAGPHGVVITPDGRLVYVSSDGASTVSVIDTTTDSVKATIEVGKTPHGLALTPDAKTVLVAGFGTNQLSFIDVATNTVSGGVPVPSPHNIAITPDGHRAYVASQVQGSAALVIVDLSSRSVVGRVALDKVPRALNFSPDSKQLYFTEAGASAVQVLDPTSNTIVDHIPVGASPHHPLFVGSSQTALVVVQGPGQVAVIDTATKAVTAVPVGQMPHWIAVSSDGAFAYVTNENSNDVSVISIAAKKVIATVPIGAGPRKIVIQHGLVAPPTTAG
jgi:YVTN family beta-propeller protein